MPAPKKGPRLGGTPAHQRQLMANLAAQLFEAEGITTTVSRAKLLKPMAERLITKAKKGGLHEKRQVMSVITDRDVAAKLFADISEAPQGLELGDVGAATSGSPDLDLPIEDLDLSERPRNCLKRAQVNTIGELLVKTDDDLLAITNFGQKSLDEVLQKLDERGLALRNKEG